MARRYHCTPVDLLRMDPFELSVCFESMVAAEAAAASEIRRSKDAPIFPVLIVGSL